MQLFTLLVFIAVVWNVWRRRISVTALILVGCLGILVGATHAGVAWATAMGNGFNWLGPELAKLLQ